MPTYAYSIHGENYTEDLNQIHQELFDAGYNHGNPVTISRGIMLNCTHADFITNDEITRLFEQISENAENFAGEYADDYAFDLEPEQIDHFRKLILTFIQQNYDEPTFWQVDKPQEFHIKADFSTIHPEIFEAIL
ncbi:MAG: hypothetical protein COB13_008525 [OCS116 cluster bacterium]|nr:hypothetical protein [OCS116 cluster bacterium]